MFVPVKIESDGIVQAHRGFDMMQSQARDMSAPLTAIGESLIESVQAQYMSEGAWSGTPWQPLTEKYAAWKDSHVPGLPMLVGIQPKTHAVSGEMRRAVLDPLALHVRPTFAIWEPENPIARFHQEGTEKMPARPVVMLTVQLLREWDRIWVRWLNTLGSLVGAK